MTYIKINKPSLDYHHYSDFHVFTMNNFVRNVMQKGKYKKAVQIVRSGLINGLKQLHRKLRMNDAQLIRTYSYYKRTTFTETTQTKIEQNFLNKFKKYDAAEVIKCVKVEDLMSDYYRDLHREFKYSIPAPSLSFTDLFDYDTRRLTTPLSEEEKFIYEKDGEVLITNKLPPEEQIDYQYNILKSLKFKKIYSKKPDTRYYSIRNLTVFDMVIQVYTMLTGVWYMRKAKVSGRTILIPSPLRPYRRVVTVTKMLLKGIRKRRQEERYLKNAMSTAISTEFYWLLLYNGIQYTRLATMIDNSYVWNAKTDSHKELVANLKNIKHLKYF